MAALKSLIAIRAKYVQKQQEKVNTAAAVAAATNPFKDVTNWNWKVTSSPIQQSQSAVAWQFTVGSNPFNGANNYMAGTCAPAQGYNNDVAMDIDDASYNSSDVSMSDVSSDMDMDIISDAMADITMSDVPYASPEIHMSDAWDVDSLCDEDRSDGVLDLTSTDNKLKILAGKTWKKRAAGLPQLEDSRRLRPREDNRREHIAAEISKSRATIEKWQKVLAKIRLEMQSGYVDVKRKERGECLLAEEWKRLDRLDMEYYMASKYGGGLDECCVY